MENMSKAPENCQTLDFSNQKLNSLEEKHEIDAGHLLRKRVETMVAEVGSITQSCQTIGSSTLKQNTSNERNALVSNDVLSEPNDNGIVGPVADENLHVSGNSNMNENIIRGKTELDSGRVVGESSAPLSVSPYAQHCQTMGSKDNELTLEKVQCELMETGVVQSDSVEAVGSDAKEKSNIIGSSNIEENEVGVIPEHSNKYVQSEQEEISAEESDAQTFQTMVSSHNKPCSEQGAMVGKRILESDSVEAGVSGSKPGGSAAQGFHITGGSILEQNGSDATIGLGPEHVSVEPKNDLELGSEPMETRTVGFDAHNFQRVEHFSEHVKGEPTEMRIDPVDVGLLNTPPIRAIENSNSTDHKDSAASSKSKKRKSTTPITGVPRVLRPRVNGFCKNPETYGSSGNVTGEPGGSSANVNDEREKRKKKRKRTTQEVDDEFSKTRKRLRYFLTRIGYEHNFIEAYCGEGWKGQSAEKIKPEKELQHAASRILQCKRRIRELFQHLDSSFAEGRFQESLFDSEGEISSDDIFCSKCGSKDLSADNDIILCDGICDRGFHQMCLKPPLLKEEIPPGDEGWLCPGCDCKVDCIDLLNDSQGTDLSIEDAWEKVFPEAAATVDGGMNDDILGLPSDDSEDDEYNPETLEVEEGLHSEVSSSEDSEDSEDSDFTSDSDDIGVRPMDDPYMGLPSEDSEDDDFDPDAPDPEKINEESSCSDFTSASEYFSASSDDNGSSGAEDDPMPSSVDGSKLPGANSKGKKAGNKKKMNSELLSLLESGSQSDALPLSGKRQREQLDYKKLHDEAYGNDSSDSSDDEDWTEGAPSPRLKDDGAGEESSLPRNTDSKTTTGRRNTKGLQRKDSEENGITSTRKTRQKKDVEGESNTAAEMQIDSPEPDLDDKRSGSSSSKGKALGEAVTERLYESFRENEYPTRDTKENLSKELGITIQQITKWFGNARWSLRHQSSSETKKTNKFSETKDKTPSKLGEPEKEMLPNGVDNNEIQEPSEAGNSKDPRSGRDDSAELDHQTPKEDSTNDRTLPASPIQDHNKPVEPEAKILPGDRELIEAGTPRSLRTVNEVCATPDHQTPNGTSDRELVIAIKANVPTAEEVKKKGQANSASTEEVKKKGRKVNKVVPTRSQIQTRSRKSVTPQNK